MQVLIELVRDKGFEAKYEDGILFYLDGFTWKEFKEI